MPRKSAKSQREGGLDRPKSLIRNQEGQVNDKNCDEPPKIVRIASDKAMVDIGDIKIDLIKTHSEIKGKQSQQLITQEDNADKTTKSIGNRDEVSARMETFEDALLKDPYDDKGMFNF